MMVVTPMVDLTDQWALQLYMPHDNMLWIWMRVGMIGFAVFWMTVASVLFLIVGSIRIGVRRLNYLKSLEDKPDPGKDQRERGLTGDVPGLRVVHIKPRKDAPIVGHTRDMALEKAHREELQEAAEFLVLAFLALASFVSMLTLAVVDQGLMSPRLSSYWGLVLGALTVGWEIKRLDFLRPGVRDKTVIAELPGARGRGKKELERDKGKRVRVITGPSNAA